MWSIIKKILDVFKGEKKTETGDDNLTNRRILEELSGHFKQYIDAESVGQRMMYPMSFNILMDPDDYNQRKESLPYILPEVVAAFYGIIDDYIVQYPNYTPPAKYWYFQFTSCQMREIQNGKNTPLIVKRGHITTVATLLTFDIRNVRNQSVDSNTRVSIKLEDSTIDNGLNVNMEALSSIDIISEGSFIFRFDKSLPKDPSKINGSNMELAELSYSRGGLNYHFAMQDDLIHISGKNEMRKGRSFFILESPTIKDSHVQIKHDNTDNCFYLAAFGPVRLNDHKIDESSGTNVIWHKLANHSSIFINNEIKVRFDIKQH